MTLKEMARELRSQADRFNKAASLIEGMTESKNGKAIVQKAARRMAAEHPLHTETLGTNGKRRTTEDLLAFITQSLTEGPKTVRQIAHEMGLKQGSHLYQLMPQVARKARGKGVGMWVAKS